MLAFRYDTSTPVKRVLVPEGINSDSIGEWLHTLDTSRGYTYAVTLSDFLLDYYPTEEERVSYVMSFVRGLSNAV